VPGVEERAPRVRLDFDARRAGGPQRRRRRDHERHRARRRFQAVAIGHQQRAGGGTERDAHVDGGRRAPQRSGRHVVGTALGAQEDDLVCAPEPAAAQPQEGAAVARLPVLAAPHARPPLQLRRGTHHDPRRRGRGGRSAGRAVGGGRRRRDGCAPRAVLLRGSGSHERQRHADGICGCAPTVPRGHPPMGHALLLVEWPAGLADGLAHPHALPGGNAWIRPRVRVPRSARPKRIRPKLCGTGGSICIAAGRCPAAMPDQLSGLPAVQRGQPITALIRVASAMRLSAWAAVRYPRDAA